eukprot:COSAG01_NODE_1553_length_9931_cov_3.092657_10_plen_40_part_00
MMVYAQFDGGEAPHPMTGGSVLSGTQVRCTFHDKNFTSG